MSSIMSDSYILVKSIDSSFLSHDVTKSILFSLISSVRASFVLLLWFYFCSLQEVLVVGFTAVNRFPVFIIGIQFCCL